MQTEVSRVMFAGDWHGNLGWAANCVGMADLAHADAVVQLGDFGIWPGEGGRRYLDMLEIALASVDLTCYFIDGNHEDFPQLYGYPLDEDGTRIVRPHIRHLPRGYRWTWSNTTFLALGGATSLDKPSRREGVTWWPEEEITMQEADAARDGGHADVMLTHDCPARVPIPGINAETDKAWPAEEIRRANLHRELLASVVDTVDPEWLVHGHFHISYEATRSNGTKVIGLGADGDAGNTTVVNLLDWTRE